MVIHGDCSLVLLTLGPKFGLFILLHAPMKSRSIAKRIFPYVGNLVGTLSQPIDFDIVQLHEYTHSISWTRKSHSTLRKILNYSIEFNVYATN